MTFRAGQCLGRHALGDGNAGNDDPASPELGHQRAGDIRAAGGGQGDWQQPGLKGGTIRPAERGEAEEVAQRAELFVARWAAGCVIGERLGLDRQLATEKGERRRRDQLARAQQPAALAQGAELNREAEAIMRPSSCRDGTRIRIAQNPMPRERRFVGGDRHQRVALRRGQQSAARHGSELAGRGLADPRQGIEKCRAGNLESPADLSLARAGVEAAVSARSARSARE